MLDLKKATVEIVVNNDGRLWVNVDDECVLRVKESDTTIAYNRKVGSLDAMKEADDG